MSVIIPTTGRPDLLQRALRSVFAQTLAAIEVIVVIDGPNPATVGVLAAITDARLRVLTNDSAAGAGPARNLGAARARGEWLAFLDDDDEWTPQKLERQLATAGAAPVLVSCRSRVVTPRHTYFWPRTLYDGRMPVDEYLFDRRSLFRGDAHFGTSTYLLPRELFGRTQFGDSAQNEDTTLLLRVAKQAGARVVVVPEALVTLYKEEARPSLGSRFDWRTMLAWADSMGPLLTPRAYSGFCLIYLGSQAALRRDYAGFAALLRRAFASGSPTMLQLAVFLAFWVLPMRLRQRLRAFASRARTAPC